MNKWPHWLWGTIIAAVVVAAPLIVANWFAPKEGALTVPYLFSVVIIVIVAAFAAVVLGKMMTNDINLQYLISEDNGNASLSRFQFLLFTFVIAASYFLFVIGLVGKDVTTLVKDGKLLLPDIPSGVLGLIGISGASYVIAKGIQKSTDTGSSVVRVNVTDGGQGYDTAPTVTFTGGGGSGAQGTAVLDNRRVAAITLTQHGSGYLTPPTVQITPAANDHGAGAVAVAEIG